MLLASIQPLELEHISLWQNFAPLAGDRSYGR